MEELPPRHAASRHDINKQICFHSDSYINHLESVEREEDQCTLSRAACYKLAVEDKVWSIVKLHLEQTPHIVNMATNTGVTALMQFPYEPKFTHYLLSLGADVNALDSEGVSVLMHLIQSTADPEAVKMLIDAGANVHVRDNSDKHVIMHAAKIYRHDVRVVKMLLAAGVSIQDLGSETVSVLFKAMQYPDKNVELVKTLIEAGTDVNSVDVKTSQTVLMHAVKNSRTSTRVVEMLIDAGADVNSCVNVSSLLVRFLNCIYYWFYYFVLSIIYNMGLKHELTYEYSTLQVAVKSKHEISVEIVKLLIDRGANIHVQNEEKNSPLMLAASNKTTDILSLLIDAGADVNHCNVRGETALMMAENERVAKILVENGANVNAKDKLGYSVLMHVVKRNCRVNLQQIIKYLMKSGADVLAENEKNETVLTVAIGLFISAGNKQETLYIIKLLLQQPALNVEVLCSGANHPQKVFLLFDVPWSMFRDNEVTNLRTEDILQLLKLILQSQFKDTSMTENVNLRHPYIDSTNTVDMYSIALFMYTWRVMFVHICFLQSCVKLFLDAGFDMLDGVSPLTVFTLFWPCRDHHHVNMSYSQLLEDLVVEPNDITMFIDFLITHGAHVTQQMLPMRDDVTTEIVELREQLYLPDALFAAICKDNLQAIRQLLPFWGFPALYILLFTPLCKTRKYPFRCVMTVLTEHGGVPHGTEMYDKLTQFLEHLDAWCKDVFHDMQSSPLSLQELCRYQVRASLVPRASRAGHSLPNMLSELSPPGIRDFLLMETPSNLVLLKDHSERHMNQTR